MMAMNTTTPTVMMKVIFNSVISNSGFGGDQMVMPMKLMNAMAMSPVTMKEMPRPRSAGGTLE